MHNEVVQQLSVKRVSQYYGTMR